MNKENRIRREKIIGWFKNIVTLAELRHNGHYHRHVTCANSQKVYYCCYGEFVEAFNKVQWVTDKEFRNSLFDEKDKMETMFHAGIVKINNIGFLLTDYGLECATNLVERKIAEIGFGEKGKPKTKVIVLDKLPEPCTI